MAELACGKPKGIQIVVLRGMSKLPLSTSKSLCLDMRKVGKPTTWITQPHFVECSFLQHKILIEECHCRSGLAHIGCTDSLGSARLLLTCQLWYQETNVTADYGYVQLLAGLH